MVLRDNKNLVIHDEEFTLTTVVQYTNGTDLVDSQDIYVLEPDITMRSFVSNETNVGDPGMVFIKDNNTAVQTSATFLVKLTYCTSTYYNLGKTICHLNAWTGGNAIILLY